MRKYSLAALAATAVVTLAAPASAATIVNPVLGSPFTTAGQDGSFSVFPANAGNTYNFTFSLTSQFKVLSLMSATAFNPVNAAPISFAIFRADDTLVAPVSLGAISTVLGAGSYYLSTSDVPFANSLIGGAVTVSAVPEPATWAMMILGFFGLGAAMRRSRKVRPLAATA